MSLTAEQFSHSDINSALRLSQRAPEVLAKARSAASPFSLPLLGPAETPETWTKLEHVFHACLRTGDDKSAHLALERLTQRFGAADERIMGLRGLYQEAVANDSGDLKKVIQEYNTSLAENPMNVALLKRRIAILRSLNQEQEAIAALVDFLDSFPTDAEAWCELGELYHSQSLTAQAVFCLEEALLIAPNAWNLQARLGEIQYIAAASNLETAEMAQKLLAESIRRFARSIELCDDYVRGYYGLKLATAKAIATRSSGDTQGTAGIPRRKLEELHSLATSNLRELVKQWSSHQLPEIDQSTIIAAQTLLNHDT